jgi:hypothetical protein
MVTQALRFEGRRNQHIVISKQQPKDYDESVWYLNFPEIK